MAKVMEGEVVYISSCPQPVPRLTKGNVSHREGAFTVLGCFGQLYNCLDKSVRIIQGGD
jgi:hypothetical protein